MTDYDPSIPHRPEADADAMAEALFSEVLNEACADQIVQYKGFDAKALGKTEEEKARMTDALWLEDPIPFHDFVTSPDHMAQPGLSPRQRKDVESFLGKDPKRVFLNPETQYREAALLWGKGGGKDWICSMMLCWCIHILLCMRDPRKALQMPPGENIDIINVAYSADQAKSVFFVKFLNRLTGWQWLRRRYLLTQSNRAVNRDEHPGISSNDRERTVQIGSQTVLFPFEIQAHSAHSEADAYEGKSPIFWIMDEAAAFRDKGKKANGDKVYKTLHSSAKSRFPHLFRGLLISFPRSKTDFMMQFWSQAEDDPTIFRSIACTWEVNPMRSKAEFEDDYVKDPVGSRAKYECRPPGSEFGYFAEDRVAEIFIRTRTSTVTTQPALVRGSAMNPFTGEAEERNFVGKVLQDVRMVDLKDRGTPRVAHVDGGLTGDSASLVVAHGEPHIITQRDPKTNQVVKQAIKKMVVDCLLAWHPDKHRQLQVSLNNVASLIIALKQSGMNIVAVSYDQWNSASAIEALTMRGIWCDSHNITTEDYANLKTFINLGAVEVPTDDFSEWELLHRELEQLEGIQSGQRLRVDHPPEGSKDMADSLAGCLRLLNDPSVRGRSQKRQAPRPMLSRGAAVSSPFSATSEMRGGETVVGQSIRESQPVAHLSRMVDSDEELPYTNKAGQAFRPPRPILTRGR